MCQLECFHYFSISELERISFDNIFTAHVEHYSDIGSLLISSVTPIFTIVKPGQNSNPISDFRSKENPSPAGAKRV